MKTLTERIHRNMNEPRAMTPISLRLPERVIEDMKEVAAELGFTGYQALLKAYISKGLREDLVRLERQRVAEATRQSLAQHGITDEHEVEGFINATLKLQGFTGEPDRCEGRADQEVQSGPVAPGRDEVYVGESIVPAR